MSPWKAIGWSIAFFVLTFLTAGLICLGVGVLTTGSVVDAEAWLRGLTPSSMAVQAVASVLCAGLFTWLIGVRRLGLTHRDLRYDPGGIGRSGFVLGLLAGAFTAAIAILVSVVGGQAGWVSDSGGIGSYLIQSLKTVALLSPAALAEEMIFRGIPMVILASAFGRGSAIVGTSVLFAMVHAGNPNATQLGLGNIALAGIFLGLCFYAPGGIWTAFGAHLGWNSLLACLDTPVSGVPFEIPLLDYNAGDPVWLTGGTFGPEGGLAATMALTLAIVAAARWVAKSSP